MKLYLTGTKEFNISLAASAVLIGAMTLLTAWTERHELFFPEILALAMGCWVMSRKPWHVTRGMLWLSLSIGALMGMMLARCTAIIPAAVLMAAGYATVLLWLRHFRTNIVPMLSACLLPIMMKTESWLYPAAVSGLTALVCLGEWLLERAQLRKPQPFEPVPRPELRRVAQLSGIWVLLLVPMHILGVPLMAAPPLAVAYTAFADRERPVRKHWYAGVAILTAAAELGVASRWLMLEYGGFPMAAAVIPAVLIFLKMSRALEYFLPPAGAVLLLSFLLPRESLTAYAWQIPLGTIIFLTAGRLSAASKGENADGQRN